MLLADTSFVIDLMLNDEGAVEKAKELAEGSIPVFLGTPTLFELYVGVGLSVKSEAEGEKIRDTVGSLTQVPLDAPSAIRAGLIYARKMREGTKIDAEDAMLAGIALENNQPILTRKKKHFSGIHGLRVEDY
jgi:tRNA(fMet)-specific endonuclease VapC